MKALELHHNLVHCKDCKYWVSDGGALMLCDIHKDPTVPEHFCSYGCRSEKPNNSTTEDYSDVGKEQRMYIGLVAKAKKMLEKVLNDGDAKTVSAEDVLTWWQTERIE